MKCKGFCSFFTGLALLFSHLGYAHAQEAKSGAEISKKEPSQKSSWLNAAAGLIERSIVGTVQCVAGLKFCRSVRKVGNAVQLLVSFDGSCIKDLENFMVSLNINYDQYRRTRAGLRKIKLKVLDMVKKYPLACDTTKLAVSPDDASILDTTETISFEYSKGKI